MVRTRRARSVCRLWPVMALAASALVGGCVAYPSTGYYGSSYGYGYGYAPRPYPS